MTTEQFRLKHEVRPFGGPPCCIRVQPLLSSGVTVAGKHHGVVLQRGKLGRSVSVSQGPLSPSGRRPYEALRQIEASSADSVKGGGTAPQGPFGLRSRFMRRAGSEMGYGRDAVEHCLDGSKMR